MKAANFLSMSLTGLFSFFCVLLFFSSSAFADNIYGFNDELQSEAVLFVNEDTKNIVFEKNSKMQFPSAALVKIMTIILILERINPNEMEQFLNTKIEASGEIFDRLFRKNASNVDIRKGEEVPVIDLLYASILASASEATMMLVDYVTKTWPETFGRSVDAFVDLMNSKDLHKKIGLTDTNFTDPDGLDDSGQKTTANDAYRLITYCLKNPLFEKIATTPIYKMAATDFHSQPRDIIHSNHMTNIGVGGRRYYDKRVLGLKTGAYDDKFNLISMAKDETYKYILIVLGAPRTKSENAAFVDSNKLYDYAFKNLKLETIAVPGETIIPNEIKVDLGQGTDNLVLTVKRQVTLLLPRTMDRSNIFCDTSALPKRVCAPKKKGQVMGPVKFMIANRVVATAEAMVCEDLHLDLVAAVYVCGLKLFKYSWLIVLIIIALLGALWFLKSSNFAKRRGKRKIKFKKSGRKNRAHHNRRNWS